MSGRDNRMLRRHVDGPERVLDGVQMPVLALEDCAAGGRENYGRDTTMTFFLTRYPFTGEYELTIEMVQSLALRPFSLAARFPFFPAH